jgi:hypothetical protein
VPVALQRTATLDVASSITTSSMRVCRSGKARTTSARPCAKPSRVGARPALARSSKSSACIERNSGQSTGAHHKEIHREAIAARASRFDMGGA